MNCLHGQRLDIPFHPDFLSWYLALSTLNTINAINLNNINDRNNSVTDRLLDAKHHTSLLYKHDLIALSLPPWELELVIPMG